jgi:hypothetical protein
MSKCEDLEAQHRGIPRDADGNPVYLILPPKWQVQYEKDMELCRAGWQATRDPYIAAEAVSWVHLHRQPVPAWLHEALWVVAAGRRGKAHAQRALVASKHLQRYMAVRDFKADGLTWEESYTRAAGLCGGEAEAMKQSYCRVKNDLKRGHYGLYHYIRTPNSLAEWLGASRQPRKRRRPA